MFRQRWPLPKRGGPTRFFVKHTGGPTTYLRKKHEKNQKLNVLPRCFSLCNYWFSLTKTWFPLAKHKQTWNASLNKQNHETPCFGLVCIRFISVFFCPQLVLHVLGRQISSGPPMPNSKKSSGHTEGAAKMNETICACIMDPTHKSGHCRERCQPIAQGTIQIEHIGPSHQPD